MDTEKPNTSHVVSRDEIRRRAKAGTSTWQTLGVSVTGVVVTGLAYVLVALGRPNLTSLQTAFVGLPAGLVATSIVVVLEYGHRASAT
jgi:hypothetical protein